MSTPTRSNAATGTSSSPGSPSGAWTGSTKSGTRSSSTSTAPHPCGARPATPPISSSIGLNIEIMFMFAIAGIAFCKMLPADPKMKILGVPNRIFLALANSIFCVIVEIWLNSVNALTWDWSFWDDEHPVAHHRLRLSSFFPRVLLGLRHEDHAFEAHHGRIHLGGRCGGRDSLRHRFGWL